MSWAERQARLQAAVFASLGHDASWQGVAGPVRVLLRDRDEVLGMTVVDAVEIRVRQSEVDDPTEGNRVDLADGRSYELIGTPLLDRQRAWRCEAVPVAA